MLSGEVECDELYLVAGHKGQPEKVRLAGRKARCRRLKGARGRGTLATEKPPIFGMIQRTGEVRIWMLDNVQQVTIKPIMLASIAPRSLIFTDEYNRCETGSRVVPRSDRAGRFHEAKRSENAKYYDIASSHCVASFYPLLGKNACSRTAGGAAGIVVA